ncbi:HNH endonuclease [Gordonia phage Duffington]|uniref:HNH endonuclease n=1 Tax=Gordonia phage Duffington TaxID=2507858 RepID=A0A410TCP8_9CAUD|nr:HNH endonuclease [Gordonia phage Duffington]QAU06793.1 HNH endonuclease [Gordonia phage Duffington]QXO13093.1 HNH endonuclease [Gordonia phage Figliar]
MEIWTKVEGFEDYVVSPDGEVYSESKKELKNLRFNNQGDVMVDLYRDRKQNTRKVSLLVAQAYLGEPKNESFNSVIHLNGDRSDCRAINLAWRPRWFVVEYNRMFLSEPINVSVQIEQTGEIFGTLREACVKYGMVEKTAYVVAHNGGPVFPHGYRLKIL